jgi:hypothetical protein
MTNPATQETDFSENPRHDFSDDEIFAMLRGEIDKNGVSLPFYRPFKDEGYVVPKIEDYNFSRPLTLVCE